MIKPAGETVHTVEERKSLPSEEAQESHVAHQGFKLPSRDTPASQKAFESFADTTKTFHSEKVRNRFTLMSKPRARPEPENTEISCNLSRLLSKSSLLAFNA